MNHEIRCCPVGEGEGQEIVFEWAWFGRLRDSPGNSEQTLREPRFSSYRRPGDTAREERGRAGESHIERGSNGATPRVGCRRLWRPLHRSWGRERCYTEGNRW